MSKVRAFLDDTAQIVGPKFDFDCPPEGRSEREREIGKFVLEKAEFVYEKAKKIGGVKSLSAFESRLMRIVYLKKYSKPEEGKEKAVTSARVLENISDREMELRQALVDYGNMLVKEDLVQGTWGNLSIRLDDKYMLVTPSGIDYARLTASDMVKVDIETLEYESELKPTSEKVLHAGIYRRRNDINAVIHTHSTWCSVFAAAEKPVKIKDDEGKRIFGERVEIAKYGFPGTKSLGERTAEAVGTNFGAIMAHHGMVACGEDIESAFKHCIALENSAKSALE